MNELTTETNPDAAVVTASDNEVSLSDRGPVLAHGIIGPNGELGRDIQVRPWRLKEERELSALRDKLQNSNMPTYVALVLSHMCSRLGPYDFAPMDSTEKQLIVSQMVMGDVFHAYCWLRMDAIGDELPMDITCPFCRKPFDPRFVADLGTLPVKFIEKPEDAYWSFELRSPITVRGKAAKRLMMGQPRWHHVMKVGDNIDTGIAKTALIQGAVRGIEGIGETALAEAELDELSKRDVEGIIASFDRNFIGPKMSVDASCPRCKRTMEIPIDWSYGGFFGPSSLS